MSKMRNASGRVAASRVATAALTNLVLWASEPKHTASALRTVSSAVRSGGDAVPGDVFVNGVSADVRRSVHLHGDAFLWGRWRPHLNRLGRQATRAEAGDDFAARRIVADAGDESRRGAEERVRVVDEIGGSSAKLSARGQQIPQNLTEADDLEFRRCHLQRVADGRIVHSVLLRSSRRALLRFHVALECGDLLGQLLRFIRIGVNGEVDGRRCGWPWGASFGTRPWARSMRRFDGKFVPGSSPVT